MKILIKVELVNIFERAELIHWIRNTVKLILPQKFRIKEIDFEVLE